MKWGIIGYGSIGKRHTDNIRALKDEVVVLTKNSDCPFPIVNSIEELLSSQPEIVFICNETALHEVSYREIRNLKKDLPLLIEKPVFDKKYNFPADPFSFVAYCLRFHPLVIELKERIKNAEILSANFYVGQYLPTWREGRDYRTTYSAKKELGGGVLRDLSHELDLAYYLLGDLSLEFCKTKKISDLEISSDDYFSGFFSAKKCENVNIEMNYLDHIIQRHIVINTNTATFKVDFIRGEIITNKDTRNLIFDRNEMYLTMLKNMKEKNYKDFSSFEDGMKILDIIAEAESK